MTRVSQQLLFYLKQGCFKSRSAGFSLRTFGLSLSTMAKASSNPGTILDFEVKDIDGNTVKLDKYKGFVTVIVNVASKCGLTKTNYSQLPELHSRYAERGLRILAFPCNQFGGQEPGTEEEIKEFAQGHGVQFDVFGKIDVNGSNAHPLYVFLKNAKHGTLTNNIKWNFTKFLCDKKGVPMKRYSPTTSPVDIAKDIEKELDKE